MQRDSIQGDILITAMPITLGMSHDIHKSVSKLDKCTSPIIHIGKNHSLNIYVSKLTIGLIII